MDLGLSDARVVIVGASRGMGRAAARAFAAEGARLALLARNPKGLAKTAAQCEEAGSPEVMTLTCDITCSEQIDAAFAAIAERWSSINVLINNAANSIGTHGSFEHFADTAIYTEAHDRITLGYVRTTRAALPLLKQAGWGRIVNVSSASTPKATPVLHVYNMAKAAVVSLSQANAREFAPHGILVNVLSPGGIMVEGGNWGTVMNGYFERAGLDPNDPRDAFRIQKEIFGNSDSAMAWVDRLGTLEEYGAAICWLGSKVNSYMTGANVFVNGGGD
jgi:NAD(P)-dependent dehydrogenase (short-subunit alcohol dehydrogenase family)